MRFNQYTVQSYLLFAGVTVLTFLLPLIGRWVEGITILSSLPEMVNRHLMYQPITLLICMGFLSLLRTRRPTIFNAYFQKGNIAAAITPVPALSINPKPGRNWLHVGRDFALVISVVTAIIIYLQVMRGEGMNYDLLWKILPFSLVFSVTNSFIEESITRVGVIVALKGVISEGCLPFISAAIFGGVHYWGSPGGIAGVLAAGFLGWLLTKSILETKGIFWAWLIHFLQDVIILTGTFMRV
ncbi:hypothetical protein SAMN05192553_101737 [Cyclobacterium xiamenense]|jgi:hypothetical protein|uniref:CAAX prenyl protease 2/Lysostaphin resistance protein A-like domain-containing protein n=1 Tax=Cyclobacterium xiamenense TaxID=1297121 RepID=A0A1H6UAM1_9BACT|nr:CPBP family intramembrane glutamic endopeptidase [Cyclobacterium xiamenense]SEI89438.1 hypothetical protein SAMN05192553_101737 [Cyclobacterium xiamenense]